MPRDAAACCEVECEEKGGNMSELDEFGVHAGTRPEEALRLAMEREKKAREFYLRCVAIVADPGVKKMFEFLAKEEARHFDLIETEYNRFVVKEG